MLVVKYLLFTLVTFHHVHIHECQSHKHADYTGAHQ